MFFGFCFIYSRHHRIADLYHGVKLGRMLGREGREERLGNQERTGRRCGMTIFIGYQTALRYLRSVEDIGSLKPTKARPGTSWSIARKEIHQASAELAAFRRLIADGCPPESSARPDCRESIGERQIIGSPSDDSTALSCPGSTHDRLHFVLGSAGARICLPEFESHVWAPPKGRASFLRVGDYLAVSSPEACFAQLSRSADAITLAKLGYELCGKYRIDNASAVGFRTGPPLTTVDSIKRFARAMGLGETSKALMALDYVRDDSASPMETCLALLLGLPTCKGGYGLGIPVLNARIEAPRGVAANANHRQYHCDLYWPRYRVGLEYNSSAFHLNERAMNRDSSRMNDFEAFGIIGFTATREQVSNPRATDRLAFDLARAMGKRLRSKYADIGERRRNLRKQLFSKDVWTQ